MLPYFHSHGLFSINWSISLHRNVQCASWNFQSFLLLLDELVWLFPAIVWPYFSFFDVFASIWNIWTCLSDQFQWWSTFFSNLRMRSSSIIRRAVSAPKTQRLRVMVLILNEHKALFGLKITLQISIKCLLRPFDLAYHVWHTYRSTFVLRHGYLCSLLLI